MHGRGGNMGNMNDMLRKAQAMQEKFMKLQEELKSRTVEASAGGGAVTVTANGSKEIVSVKIDKELIASGDAEMVQDLVKAGVNEAMKKVQEMTEQETKKITGTNIPGLF